MALSDDQRAMLRLLAQREEGYEDIAALKGMSVEEVRAEVKEALSQLAVDREAGVEPPPSSPPSPAKVEAPPPASPKPSPPAKPPGRPSRPTVQPERRRLLAMAGGALGIVAVVLGAIAIFSGGSDSNSGSTAAGESGGETAFAESPTATNGKITRAILEPVHGGDAEGLAVFGRLRKQVKLAIAAKGLEQASSGEAYVVWLANSANRMVPVATAAASESGEIAAQYPIPAAVLVYLAEGAFDEIDISLVSTARYKAAFSKARKESKLPAYTGTDVLRGEVTGPIAEAGSTKGE